MTTSPYPKTTDKICECEDREHIGFFGRASEEVYKATIAKYGIPLAEELYCMKCGGILGEDDPRTKRAEL